MANLASVWETPDREATYRIGIREIASMLF
jgi:hypothetical protein